MVALVQTGLQITRPHQSTSPEIPVSYPGAPYMQHTAAPFSPSPEMYGNGSYPNTGEIDFAALLNDFVSEL
jgi:hypothetical protein